MTNIMERITTSMLLCAAPMAQAGQGASKDTVLDLLRNDSRFTSLTEAVTSAGLADLLEGDGPITVFAPIDGAFDDLPQGMAISLLSPENLDGLRALLGHHVDDRRLSTGMLPDMPILIKPINETARLCITRLPDGISIADGSGAAARAEGHAIKGSNGIVYVIDKVLIPGVRSMCD